MAKRFNPPPNWPPPPSPDWRPPAGWRPDPSWGEPPPGWKLWEEQPRAAARKWRTGVVVLVFVGVVGWCGSGNDDDTTAEPIPSEVLATETVTPQPAAPTELPPTPRAIAARPTKTKPAAKEPTAERTTARPKPRKTSRRTTAPARRTITPGAFCRNVEQGDIGYSKVGKRYRCIYDSDSNRSHWKPA